MLAKYVVIFIKETKKRRKNRRERERGMKEREKERERYKRKKSWKRGRSSLKRQGGWGMAHATRHHNGIMRQRR